MFHVPTVLPLNKHPGKPTHCTEDCRYFIYIYNVLRITLIIIACLLSCCSTSYISKWLWIGADSGSSDTTYLILLLYQVKFTIKWSVLSSEVYYQVKCTIKWSLLSSEVYYQQYACLSRIISRFYVRCFDGICFFSSFLLKLQRILYYLISKNGTWKERYAVHRSATVPREIF